MGAAWRVAFRAGPRLGGGTPLAKSWRMTMRLLALALMVATGCIEGPEQEDPGLPIASSITCPPQLALTGGPYRFDCTLEFSAPVRDVNAYSFRALDMNDATWAFADPPVAIDRTGMREGSVVFTVEGANAPPLGSLWVWASVWVSDPVVPSRAVVATMNVVAP